MTRALAAGRRFCATAGLGREATDRLAIVLEEWVMNVVEHGRADPLSLIVLRLERRENAVRLTLSDAGVAFDPRTATFNGPNTGRGGGAGLALVLTWCRIDSYRRRRGRNRLQLSLSAG